MVRAVLGTSLTLCATVSGLWSFGDSQGAAWLPLLTAILGMLPVVGGWVTTLVGIGPELDPPLWQQP